MKHRLFLAVEIPPVVAAPVVALQSQLDKMGLPIRWEPIEKLHLTTNFIGKVDDEKLHSIADLAKEVSGRYQPFTLEPAFLETMYRKHEGSYIYLGIGGDIEPLKNLQQELALLISDMQIAQPAKYLPHVTIGKLQKMDPNMTKDTLQRIREVDFTPLPQFTVDHLTLYESLLSRDASHFRKIRRFVLS